MNARSTLRRVVLSIAASLSFGANAAAPPPLEADRLPTDPDRPNVLWIYVEDTSPWMGCYGDTNVETPNIDALAARGVRFDRAYMPAPVCSPTRSAVITSMYQTSIGAHEHYSSIPDFRGKPIPTWDPNYLGVRTIPEILRLAGYYTFNEGKFHYNFVFDPDALYDHHDHDMGFKGAIDGSDWSGVPDARPFFGQIQLLGGKRAQSPRVTDPEDVPIPPYYPDHPVYRERIAFHYDTIAALDAIVGDIVDALRRDGLEDNTVIVFFSDHGMELPRHKQFLYEGGLRVPLIIAGPTIPQGVVRDDLVNGIDLGATTLRLAGVNLPPHMQGRDLFGEEISPDLTVCARDRCDYTIDRIRAVVTRKYKYIRNFMTDRPYLQPQYRDGTNFMRTLKQLAADDQLTPAQRRFVSDRRPAEELYDLEADPHELNNLAASPDPTIQRELAAMRDRLANWIIETNDLGRFPESDQALQAVLEVWGDKAVNPEYERARQFRSQPTDAFVSPKDAE